MYVSKQKKFMSKCRSCGNENPLDDTHRAGSHLSKHVPKNMDEIEVKKGGAAEAKPTTATTEAGAPEEKKDKKKKKKQDGEEEPSTEAGIGAGEEQKEKKKKKKKEVEEEADEGGLTGLTLESEEIGKSEYLLKLLLLVAC